MEEGARMKQGRFDERLDEIMVRAAMRLQERMRLAYFRGNLTGYLERIGLAGEIEPERLKRGSLLELQDEAAIIMAAKIRQARSKGYLKEWMKTLNMQELLVRYPDSPHGSSAAVKSKNQPSCPLKMVKGKHGPETGSSAEQKTSKPQFTLIQ